MTRKCIHGVDILKPEGSYCPSCRIEAARISTAYFDSLNRMHYHTAYLNGLRSCHLAGQTSTQLQSFGSGDTSHLTSTQLDGLKGTDRAPAPQPLMSATAHFPEPPAHGVAEYRAPGAPMDDEIAALGACVEALGKISVNGQERAIEYLSSRFGA